MANQLDKFADSLLLFNHLSIDSPTYTAACKALGVDAALLLPIKPQGTVIPVTEQTVEQSRNEPELPKQQRQNFAFNVTYLSQYEAAKVDQQPKINEIMQHPPLIITPCNTTNSGQTPDGVNNERMFWRGAMQWLRQSSLSNQIDEIKLTKTIASQQPLTTLPLKQRIGGHQSVWVYIEQSQDNLPLHTDLLQFKQQLARILGINQIERIYELSHHGEQLLWRKVTTSQQPFERYTSSVPMPTGSPHVIIIGDPLRFSQPKLQPLLSLLESRAKVLLRIGTRIHKDWHYWGLSSDCVESDNEATENLLAILSTTPVRFTLAMIRELRQKITHGSVAIECDIYNHPELIWKTVLENGYWASPAPEYQQRFKSLAADIQIKALAIIEKHLPTNAPSLSHEHYIIAESLSPVWQQQNKEKLVVTHQFFSQFNRGLVSGVKTNMNLNLLGYMHHLSNRIGDQITHLPKVLQQAVTTTNYYLKQQGYDVELSEGLDAQLYQELLTADKTRLNNSTVRGFIGQDNISLTLYNQGTINQHWPENPKKILELKDVSHVIVKSEQAKSREFNMMRDVQIALDKQHGSIEITTPQEALTLTTQSSKDFYWAKSLSMTREGVVAKTNYVQVSWPNGEVPNAQRGYLGAVIELTDDAPKWMLQFKPQLDEYGLFAEIILKDERFKLRYIPPGSFVMGSPEDEPEREDVETPHRVSLTQGCWLGETTVSQALWQMVMGDNPSKFIADDLSDYPVENINWLDSQLFVQGLNKRLHGLSLSLPTEAQWEYSCRAGTSTPFNTGNNLTTAQANYDGNYPYADFSTGDYRAKTAALTMFSPNAWGLYQMHGNVLEWCEDEFRKYDPVDAVDPVNHSVDADENTQRVLRGGSWYYVARPCRSAIRLRAQAGLTAARIGLRVAQVEPSKASE